MGLGEKEVCTPEEGWANVRREGSKQSFCCEGKLERGKGAGAGRELRIKEWEGRDLFIGWEMEILTLGVEVSEGFQGPGKGCGVWMGKDDLHLMALLH